MGPPCNMTYQRTSIVQAVCRTKVRSPPNPRSTPVVPRTSWLGHLCPDRAERAFVTALTQHRVALWKMGSRTMSVLFANLFARRPARGRATTSATWSGTFAVASAVEAAYRPANLARETSANLVGRCRISSIVECGKGREPDRASVVPSVRTSPWRNFPIMSPFELSHGQHESIHRRRDMRSLGTAITP